MKKQNGLIAAAVAAAMSAPVYAAEVSISGAVEVEASNSEDFAGATATDIVVATAAVGVDAKLNERVSATLAFLYEEDDTDFGLDEGYITMAMNKTTSLVAGRMYVPFGSFESNMVSDPLTLELGETSETALLLGMESGNVSGSVYTFNGDADEDKEIADGDNAALSFGANIAFANDNMSIGASYISNIAETDGLSGATADVNGVANVDSAVAGYGFSFGYTMGNFSVIAEHVTAADKFAATDLGGATIREDKPRATNVEVAVALQNGTLAAAYQVSSETAFMGLPKYITSVAYTFEPMKDVGMGLEYASMEDFKANGSETANVITAQLAVEF